MIKKRMRAMIRNRGKGAAERNIEFHYEISVLFIIYNSDFTRIRQSLASILYQEEVSFEIIVSDDGSLDNHKTEIEAFFSENGFKDYKLIMNQVNKGTVANYSSGLRYAEGRFTKTLSPGDCLYDKRTLRGWIDHLVLSGKEWSFADAEYYDPATGERLSVPAHPQYIKPYLRGSAFEIKWQYVVHNDIALGAAILSTTQIQKKYLKIIEDVGIKYAEDNMWRIMVFDDFIPAYYDQVTILYEYGTGVSTAQNAAWAEKLREDWKKADFIMQTKNPLSFSQKIMLYFMYPGHSSFQSICQKTDRHMLKRQIANQRLTRK